MFILLPLKQQHYLQTNICRKLSPQIKNWEERIEREKKRIWLWEYWQRQRHQEAQDSPQCSEEHKSFKCHSSCLYGFKLGRSSWHWESLASRVQHWSWCPSLFSLLHEFNIPWFMKYAKIQHCEDKWRHNKSQLLISDKLLNFKLNESLKHGSSVIFHSNHLAM